MVTSSGVPSYMLRATSRQWFNCRSSGWHPGDAMKVAQLSSADARVSWLTRGTIRCDRSAKSRRQPAPGAALPRLLRRWPQPPSRWHMSWHAGIMEASRFSPAYKLRATSRQWFNSPIVGLHVGSGSKSLTQLTS